MYIHCVWRLYCHCLFFISPLFGTSGRLCFVIVAFSGCLILNFLFICIILILCIVMINLHQTGHLETLSYFSMKHFLCWRDLVTKTHKHRNYLHLLYTLPRAYTTNKCLNRI